MMDTSKIKSEEEKDCLNFKSHPMLETLHYEYQQFFPIVRNKEDIRLNFGVKAYSNAHILFSSMIQPLEETPVYEIVLGADHNRHCTIRRQKLRDDKSYVKFSNIISGDEWRYFWIRISSQGLIEIGKRGNDLPFMLWQDPSPIDIQYCSFSSWYNTAAFWFFEWNSGNDASFEILSSDDVSSSDSD